MTFLGQLRAASPLLFWSTMLLLATLPALALGWMTDGRQILGLNRWVKPIKFILSTATFNLTFLWLLKDAASAGFALWAGSIVGAMMIGENVLIIFQAWRGVTSHFNSSSPLDTAIFGLMGMMILVNTAAVAAFLVHVFGESARTLPTGYLWGIRLGTALFLLGSLEAAFMLRIQAHTVGAPDGGAGLPFLNWSVRHGDLRIAHFIGLHALQALPLAGYLCDRLGVASPVLAVSLAAAAWLGLFLLTLLQALSGKPLLF